MGYYYIVYLLCELSTITRLQSSGSGTFCYHTSVGLGCRMATDGKKTFYPPQSTIIGYKPLRSERKKSSVHTNPALEPFVSERNKWPQWPRPVSTFINTLLPE